MGTFVNIEIKKITAAEQTRKAFDEVLLNELAESIKKQGILQPILVREKGKGYEIIAGERRFRAAKIAELKFMPCHVVEMDDQQALEAQITENLQRKDVHPMEEAHAFKRLMDEAKMNIEEVAAKVGKGTRYVAGRLKLLDLSEDFQKALFADKMPVAGAIRIAATHKELQAEYWEEDWSSDWEDSDFYKSLSDIEHDLKCMSHKLKDAKFDITDAELVPSVGACTDCPKNTACYKLLFQEEGTGSCTDRACFENKTNAHKQAILKDIVDNHPDHIFLPGRYYTDKEKLAAVKALGVEIADPEKWDVLEAPEPPDPDMHDMEDDDEREYYQSELEEYKALLARYEQAIHNGGYRKAYHIQNEIMVNVVPAKGAKPEPGSLDDTDPELAKQIRLKNEISELQSKLGRNEELVTEKTFAWMQSTNALGEDYIRQDCGLNHLEDAALMLVLFELMDYGVQRDMADEFKFERHKKADIYRWLVNEATVEDQFRIMRSAIINRLSGAADMRVRSGEITALMAIGEDFLGTTYQEALTSNKEAYAKRQASIQKQIAELEAELNAIKPTESAKPKKSKKN